MITKETTLTWLDDHHKLSFEELIQLSGLSQATLQLLIENGALVPNHLPETVASNNNIRTWHFSSHHLVSIRTLSRLKRDFDLENNSLSLVLLYLERIRVLEQQLQQLNSRNDH